jgi:hypothetical protein
MEIIPMKHLFFSALILSAFTLSSPMVSAQEHTVTVNRGTRDTAFLDINNDIANVALTANRSYSCIILNREYDGTIPKSFPVFNTLVTAPNNTTFSANAVGAMKPGIAIPGNLIASQNNLRISFIPELTGNHKFTFTDAQTGGIATPGTTLRCNDTSLYGGFNRFFANIVVVELTNETSQTVKPFITIVDTFGNVLVDNVFPAQLASNNGVAAEGRADIIFSDLPEGVFGQIIVTYVGSLGALSAYVAEYDFDGQVLTLKRERPMDTTPVLP